MFLLFSMCICVASLYSSEAQFRERNGYFSFAAIVSADHLKEFMESCQNLKNKCFLKEAEFGSLEGVKHCIEHEEADKNGRDANGFTALHLSARNGHKEVVEYLIKIGADIEANDKIGATPLLWSAGSGNLIWAPGSGNLEVLKILLDNGANIKATDAAGFAVLHVAALENQLEIVQFLIEEKGVDKDAKGDNGLTPLLIALRYGYKDLAKYLIQKGASVHVATSREKITALHFAAKKGLGEIINSLLQKGVYVDAKDISGLTAFHWATKKRRVETMRLLLENGADIHAQDNDGFTSLHFASSDGYKEVVEFLVEKGANVRYMYNNVPSPLAMATINGNREVIRFFQDQGVFLSYEEYIPAHLGRLSVNMHAAVQKIKKLPCVIL